MLSSTQIVCAYKRYIKNKNPLAFCTEWKILRFYLTVVRMSVEPYATSSHSIRFLSKEPTENSKKQYPPKEK